jgi:hypothetical protein
VYSSPGKEGRGKHSHILISQLAQETLHAEAATTEFNAVTSDVPSFLPQPDGTQRILNASRALTVARSEMMKAHYRLNDYLERGTVPEDLKQRSK